jgi:hypothetical protein
VEIQAHVIPSPIGAAATSHGIVLSGVEPYFIGSCFATDKSSFAPSQEDHNVSPRRPSCTARESALCIPGSLPVRQRYRYGMHVIDPHLPPLDVSSISFLPGNPPAGPPLSAIAVAMAGRSDEHRPRRHLQPAISEPIHIM